MGKPYPKRFGTNGPSMIEFLDKGLVFTVKGPMFGKQDRGITPGGAMDMFSYETGNRLLGNRGGEPALEIILPPVIRFRKDGWFLLTGAHWNGLSLFSGENRRVLNHAEVYRASAGDSLRFGEKIYGFRSYLCYKAAGDGNTPDPAGRQRGTFEDCATWPDKLGFIRVIDGPEYHWVKNPDDFLAQSFRIGGDSNAMGLRLIPTMKPLEPLVNRDMISEPVADGTIQLTASGPVILLRHRQTIGGYPRIFNVITPDLDVLAQMEPQKLVRFRRVSMEEAVNVLQKRNNDLTRYQS